MPVSFIGFGGGHGLYVTLRALNLLKSHLGRNMEICGVVGVSDDGGSSGRLRNQFPIVPPGDLRMALAALCPQGHQADSRGGIEEFLQYRFASEPSSDLSGHVVGNVMLTALWAQGHSTVRGLEILGNFLGAQGRVLPATNSATVMKAQVSGLNERDPEHTCEVVGQVAVATTMGHVINTEMQPPDPKACPESVEAVHNADYLVFGPGSWFTSVTTHLLIPELREAIRASSAKKMLVINLHEQQGETTGFSSVDYLTSWIDMAAEIPLDFVIADPDHVDCQRNFHEVADRMGVKVVWARVAHHSDTHDPVLLSEAFDSVVTMERGKTWQ